MKRHLTVTGYDAGAPICGSTLKTPIDAHAAWSPIDKPEFRATCCDACLKAYADSYVEDGVVEDNAPQWVLTLLKP